MAIMPSSA